MKKFTINEHNTSVLFTSNGLKKHIYCVQDMDANGNGYSFYFSNKKDALTQALDQWTNLTNQEKKGRVISVFKIDASNIYQIENDGTFQVSGYNPIKEYSL